VVGVGFVGRYGIVVVIGRRRYGMGRYRKTSEVEAVRLVESRQVVHRDGHIETGESGDWLLQGGGVEWIVTDAYFKANYEAVEKKSKRSSRKVTARG
jgi:hypothetical protein